MIFSKIDINFSIYRDSDVFLFGASSTGYEVKKIMENFKININAFVDNSKDKVGTKFYGIDVISFEELELRIKDNNKKYIIQICSTYEDEIAGQLGSINANFILYSEWKQRIKVFGKYLLVKSEPDLKESIFEEDWTYTLNSNYQSIMRHLYVNRLENKKFINIYLGAPKVGGTSLVFSCGGKLIRLWESYTFMSENVSRYVKNSKVNLIIGIRDAISQNVSLLYEEVCKGSFWDLMENIGEGQEVFDKHIIRKNVEEDCWYERFKQRLKCDMLVQNFFEQQIEPFFGVDIYQYPFDKEKGYSVYEIGNLNIMIYQVEKMDLLEKEIGDFLKIEKFELKKGNIAEEKWYKDYYKSGKKEIKLTKEYFGDCYSGKYMNHFYSEEDIAHFKNCWIDNVQ